MAGEFTEDGTETHFTIGSEPACVKAVSSGEHFTQSSESVYVKAVSSVEEFHPGFRVSLRQGVQHRWVMPPWAQSQTLSRRSAQVSYFTLESGDSLCHRGVFKWAISRKVVSLCQSGQLKGAISPRLRTSPCQDGQFMSAIHPQLGASFCQCGQFR